MRILLVEDDESVAVAIAQSLTIQTYVVDIAGDGIAGWDLVKAFPYDLIMLDVMLPKLDGISLCQQLRTNNYQTPILMLTARDTSTDKVKGLDAGADDYLVKPIDLLELGARVRTLLRRGSLAALPPILQWGDLHLNPSSCEVDHAGQIVPLTRKEYMLLELFMRNPRMVFTRAAILEHLWSFDDPPSEDTIKAHIKGMRHKLKAVGAPSDCIETVYGQGYRMNSNSSILSSSAHKNQGQTLGHTEQLAQDEAAKAQQTREAMAQLWQRFKHTNLERLAILQAAAIAYTENRITAAQHQQCIQAAHKLTGSLGTFGLPEASQAARQVEHLLEANSVLTGLQPQQFRDLVQDLQKYLDATSSDVSQSPNLPAKDFSRLNTQGDRPAVTKILAVDDDPSILAALMTLLEPCGFKVTTLIEPAQFWDTLETTMPDLLVLDLNMPDFDGIELCQVVRNDLRWSWLPILFLTSATDAATIHRLFAAGADDYVSKPITGTELVARISNRLERHRVLRTITETDALTGVANHRQSTQDLDRLLHLAERQSQPLSFVILDLDKFKQINALYGNTVGDQILYRLGELLRQTFRSEDVIARWSEEEFIVGMYGMTKRDSIERLAEILEILRKEEFSPDPQLIAKVTFSAGVAQYPQDGHDVQSLYQAANAVLYQAKLNGGDRILPTGWQPLPNLETLVINNTDRSKSAEQLSAQSSLITNDDQEIITFSFYGECNLKLLGSQSLSVDVALIHPEALFATSLLRALETRGYQACWLPNGQAAIDSLSGKTINLQARVIILNDKLSDIDGLAVLKRLSLAKVVPHTRVIMVVLPSTDTSKLLKLGAFDYAIAPCSIPVLMQRLRNALS